MWKGEVHPYIAFIVDLIILQISFIKIMITSVYRYLFQTKKSVRHEIVLITGSAKGLGRQLAIEFASLGSILILLDNNDKENQKTIELVKAKGLSNRHIFAYHCDLMSREEITEVSKRIKQDVGSVTMIVNNAGMSNFKSFFECNEDEFISTLRVNLFSSYWILKEFLPSMLKKNHGHIISVANSSGLFGFCHMSDTSTSKFAMVGLMESLDHELNLAGYDGVITTHVYSASFKSELYSKSRRFFNYITEPMDPKFVAKRIMSAILRNKKSVCIPKALYCLSAIKSILPPKAFMLLADFVLQPTRPKYDIIDEFR